LRLSFYARSVKKAMAKKRISGAEREAAARALAAAYGDQLKSASARPKPKVCAKITRKPPPPKELMPEITPEMEEEMSIAARKDLATARKTEAQAAKSEYELEILKGKYIAREELIRELISRALVLDLGLRHRLKDCMADIIDIVGGSHDNMSQVMEEVNRHLDEQMNIFANTKSFILELTEEPVE